jgi:hypothetical protein
MVRFVIVATQRTGTTFLRTCLDSHPQIECAGSIFSQVNRFKYFRSDRPNSIYRRFRTHSLQRRLAHWVNRKKLIHECLDAFFAEPTGAIAKGFKTCYTHLKRYPEVIRWLEGQQFRVIHLVRNNLLKRYLSGETKRVRGFAHSTSPVRPVSVHVRLDKLKKDLGRKPGQVRMYRELFMDQPYLEVSYESLIGDREVETRRLLRFLDVDETIPLVTDQVKLNPDSIEQIIENYDEVVRGLRGTPFETYLRD